MQSEKPVATNNGLINIRLNGLTMDNYKLNQNKLQFNSTPSRGDLLEQSKLSRLPERTPFRLPERTPFRLPDFDNAPTKTVAVVAVCAGCGARLDFEDTIQKRFASCRKCVSIYGRVDAAREEIEKSERRQLLEKFAAEVAKR